MHQRLRLQLDDAKAQLDRFGQRFWSLTRFMLDGWARLDERAMPGLDSEAIDFRAASESFAAVRRLGKKDLDTLRLVTEHPGRQVPTAGGMPLFGLDRLRYFPDAWIQVDRFSGADRPDARAPRARSPVRARGSGRRRSRSA